MSGTGAVRPRCAGAGPNHIEVSNAPRRGCIEVFNAPRRGQDRARTGLGVSRCRCVERRAVLRCPPLDFSRGSAQPPDQGHPDGDRVRPGRIGATRSTESALSPEPSLAALLGLWRRLFDGACLTADGRLRLKNGVMWHRLLARRRLGRRLRLQPQMCEDLLDHRPLEDGRNDPELAGAAIRAVLHVDVEHALSSRAQLMRPGRPGTCSASDSVAVAGSAARLTSLVFLPIHCCSSAKFVAPKPVLPISTEGASLINPNGSNPLAPCSRFRIDRPNRKGFRATEPRACARIRSSTPDDP